MEDKNMIKLSDLLGTCLEFTQEPTEEHERAYKKIVADFIVTNYIPIMQKEMMMVTILNCCTSKDLDAITTEINLTAAKTVYGILGYVANLQNDLEFAAFDGGAIDMLYSLGIIDEILNYCSKDYERLNNMINEAMNFSNLMRLAELATYMAPENIEAFTQTILDMKKELTPERLESLKSLATAGSPEWAALKETIADEVIGRVMDKDFKTIEVSKKKRVKIKKAAKKKAEEEAKEQESLQTEEVVEENLEAEEENKEPENEQK